MSGKNQEIQVFVKSLNGKTYIVNVKPTDKVEKLITLAAEKTNTDIKEMRLLFISKDLTD